MIEKYIPYFVAVGLFVVGLVGIAILNMNTDIFETEEERQLKAEQEQALRNLEIVQRELEYLKQTNRDSVPILGKSLEQVGQQIKFLP